MMLELLPWLWRLAAVSLIVTSLPIVETDSVFPIVQCLLIMSE